jgi:hypothetical protein
MLGFYVGVYRRCSLDRSERGRVRRRSCYHTGVEQYELNFIWLSAIEDGYSSGDYSLRQRFDEQFRLQSVLSICCSVVEDGHVVRSKKVVDTTQFVHSRPARETRNEACVDKPEATEERGLRDFSRLRRRPRLVGAESLDVNATRWSANFCAHPGVEPKSEPIRAALCRVDALQLELHEYAHRHVF